MIKTTLTLRQWGKSIAVCIPSRIAKSVGLAVGQPVEISVNEVGILVKAAGKPTLTLTQKLAAFDPATHGGEAIT